MIQGLSIEALPFFDALKVSNSTGLGTGWRGNEVSPDQIHICTYRVCYMVVTYYKKGALTNGDYWKALKCRIEFNRHRNRLSPKRLCMLSIEQEVKECDTTEDD